MRLLILALLVAANALSAAPAYAGDCKYYLAPRADFNNPRDEWNGWDSGIVIDGFADLKAQSADGSIFHVLHGPDLFDGDAIDYDAFKACGASFGIVKLDNLYQKHTKELSKRNLAFIPYYYFSLTKERRDGSHYSKLKEDDPSTIKTYMNEFSSIGSTSAGKFIQSMELNHPDGLPAVAVANLSGKFVALDVEEKLTNDAHATETEKIYFGRFYARATCAWIKAARAKMPDIVVMIYTTPSVFDDYLKFAYKEDEACLNNALIWAARTTTGGGDVLGGTTSKADRASQRLCIVSGGNRCIIHQYTHRFTFAVLGRPKNGHPPHTDVNRFFVVRQTSSNAGIGFVRSDEITTLVEGRYSAP